MKTQAHRETLQRIGANYDALHRHLPLPSFWMDLENCIRGHNEALATLVAAPQTDAIIGSTENALIATDAQDRLAALDLALRRTGHPQTEKDLHAFLPNGDEVFLEVSRIPLSDSDGQLAGILVAYRDVTDSHRARAHAAAQQASLEERNRAIEFDLDSAQQIQKFLMGKRAAPCPHLDVAFRYRYMEKVGGDYLCFRALDDGAYSFLLADLTGHGVTAALFMALLKYISQEAPEEVRVLPGYFLNYLDMEFYEQIPNGFFTAFAATARYDAERKRVTVEYANAAHPVSIIVRRDGSYELLDSGDFAVGLLDLVERTPHQVELVPGDRLYAYTDGFLETLDPDNNEFGLERFCETLAQHRHLPLSESIEKAYETLAHFSESDEPQDDMTLLAIEAREPVDKKESPQDSTTDPWGLVN